MNKEDYIKIINNKFSGKSKELMLEQVNLFYDINNSVDKNKYSIGEEYTLSLIIII